jgi:hypothetical protein
MDDGGKQPLSYLAPDDDAEETDRRRDGRALVVVLAVGAALVLGVWTVPMLVRMLPTPAWSPIQASPRPLPPPKAGAAASAEILAGIEAYKDARGQYPASLDQLSPRFLAAGTDRARWRYVASPDRREYWIHYVGDPKANHR